MDTKFWGPNHSGINTTYVRRLSKNRWILTSSLQETMLPTKYQRWWAHYTKLASTSPIKTWQFCDASHKVYTCTRDMFSSGNVPFWHLCRIWRLGPLHWCFHSQELVHRIQRSCAGVGEARFGRTKVLIATLLAEGDMESVFCCCC